MTKHAFTYLALGDSYTIGEAVPIHESFPYQTIQRLRQQGLHFQAPEIVAKTGWTTSELAEHILHTKLNEHYDFVTLSIGVNNQYRGLSVAEFKDDFEFLLKKALHFAGEKAAHVIVLSIPDWSVTPFAKHKDQAAISKEIEAFNAVCKTLSAQYHTHFIDITPGTQKAKDDHKLLASDGLHYSGQTHADWAAATADIIKNQVSG
ncbi:SGNH/GDSL hydrolase family protein [Chitinophagaceae bacterium LWZ2-11]